MASDEEVKIGTWMADLLKKTGRLYQSMAARQIRDNFGEKHVYRNKNGNLAIAKNILSVFNGLTKDFVWSRSNFLWRTRKDTDKPGRLQR